MNRLAPTSTTWMGLLLAQVSQGRERMSRMRSATKLAMPLSVRSAAGAGSETAETALPRSPVTLKPPGLPVSVTTKSSVLMPPMKPPVMVNSRRTLKLFKLGELGETMPVPVGTAPLSSMPPRLSAPHPPANVAVAGSSPVRSKLSRKQTACPVPSPDSVREFAARLG